MKEDAMDLKSKRYGEVDRMYWSGQISADQWEEYCLAWRNGSFRFSSTALSYQRPEAPIDDGGPDLDQFEERV